MTKLMLLIIFSLIIVSCTHYSFTGRSIPPGIRNAQLVLFEDSSGRYDLNLPDLLNDLMIHHIERHNYFRIENSSGADSRISGRIRSYNERFVSQTRDERTDQMAINITVEVSFFNNNTDEFVVRSLTVSETEHYDSSGGDQIRDRAFETLMDRLAENIILGLGSNW